MNEQLGTAVLEGVRILFRNFSGKEDQYNREGNREFTVALPTDVAEQMAKDGWNIKYLKPREEEDESQAILPVAVNFRNRPPRVVMITSRGKTALGEQEVDILDWADITNTDLIINPYVWNVNGKTGVKAYLQSIFVTIEEDELERKYGDVPDTSAPHPGPRFEEFED